MDTLKWSSRIFCTSIATVSPAELASLVSAVDAWSSSDWAPVANLSASITLIEAQDWSVDLGPRVESTVSIPGTLGSAPSALPSAIAARIVMTPSGSGLRHPGSMFHVGVDASQANGTDTLTGAAVTALNSAYTALLAAVSSVGIPSLVPVVASFRLHGAPRSPGVAFPIGSAVARPKLATQVRRFRHFPR
jgi:hypothetical protein